MSVPVNTPGGNSFWWTRDSKSNLATRPMKVAGPFQSVSLSRAQSLINKEFLLSLQVHALLLLVGIPLTVQAE